jgi:hypothetical protein
MVMHAVGITVLSIQARALFGWLAPSQPAVFFSHTSSAPATSQPTVFFSYNKSASATSHQPAERGQDRD